MDLIKIGSRMPVIGRRCGMLTVIDKHPEKTGKVIVYCDCGRTKVIYLSNLRNGNTISCGCEKSRVGRRKKTIHGLTKHPLFNVWISMIKRCENENNPAYKDYGARGIRVCSEWRVDFKVFYEWAVVNGYYKGAQLDRFPNNDGDYDPENCRFTTRKNNQNNRRCTVVCEYNGVKKSISEWGDIIGINIETIRSGLRVGKKIDYYINKHKANGFSLQ